MRLTRFRYRSIPPQGVRVRRADGSLIPCDVLRDPDQDRDGIAVWVAVPREAFSVTPGELLAMDIDVLPPKTSVTLDLPLRRGGG